MMWRAQSRTMKKRSISIVISTSVMPTSLPLMESEINSISKVTTLDDLIKKCKSFLERIRKFNKNTHKGKQEQDKRNDETSQNR